MGYEEIDDVINQWASHRNLPFYMSYKEGDVRSFEIADQSGNRYQMWIDKPLESGKIEVHIWNFESKQKKKFEDYKVTKSELFACIEDAYKVIKTWMNK